MAGKHRRLEPLGDPEAVEFRPLCPRRTVRDESETVPLLVQVCQHAGGTVDERHPGVVALRRKGIRDRTTDRGVPTALARDIDETVPPERHDILALVDERLEPVVVGRHVEKRLHSRPVERGPEHVVRRALVLTDRPVEVEQHRVDTGYLLAVRRFTAVRQCRVVVCSAAVVHHFVSRVGGAG